MKRRTNPNKSSLSSSRKAELQELIREEISQTVPQTIRQIAVEKTEIFSGPIPSPNDCESYEKVLPGFTERALSIAEKAQQAEMGDRKRADFLLFTWRMASVFFVFLLCASVVGGSIWLLGQNKNIAGFGVLLAGLATLVAAILRRQVDKS